MDKEDAPIINFYEKIVQKYIEQKRPPVELRDKVDLGYSFEDQKVILFSIRPDWHDPNKKMESPIAKAWYTKTNKNWKIYWMRASGKWVLYEPHPEVKDIASFLEVVEEDIHGCFWG